MITKHEPVCRSLPFAVTRDNEGEAGDGLTLDGLATPFGRDLAAGEEPTAEAGWTFIDSWEGQFWERFVPGSFRKTLKERTPMMQYDHGHHPLIGSLPIGTFDTVEESDEGLHVVGRLTDNWLVQPVRDAIASGGVTGMSIRFQPMVDRWEDADGKAVKAEEVDEALWYGTRGQLRRSVREAKLLEAGPVAWPAYAQTSVGVRAMEAASAIRSDPALVRDMRRALATGQHSAVEATLRDLGVRLEEAARALLLAEPAVAPKASRPGPAVDTAAIRAAVTPTDTPQETDVTETDAPAVDLADGPETRTTPDVPPTGAPVTPEGPSTPGHPEMTPQQERQARARRNYVTLSGVGKYR